MMMKLTAIILMKIALLLYRICFVAFIKDQSIKSCVSQGNNP